jgi:hypothetical protein
MDHFRIFNFLIASITARSLFSAGSGVAKSRPCAGGTSILSTGQLAILESAEQVGSKVRYKTPKNGKGRTIAMSGHLIDESCGRTASGKRKSF